MITDYVSSTEKGYRLKIMLTQVWCEISDLDICVKGALGFTNCVIIQRSACVYVFIWKTSLMCVML